MSHHAELLGLLIAFVCVAPLVILASPVRGASPGKPPRPSRSPEVTALHALFDDEWEWTMREFPTYATAVGDPRYDACWPDMSPEAHERRNRHGREVLERIVELYEVWNTVAPDTGKAEQAAKWRTELEKLGGS